MPASSRGRLVSIRNVWSCERSFTSRRVPNVKTKSKSWQTILLVALITAVGGALGNKAIEDWVPSFVRGLRTQSILLVRVRHNQQPISGVKFDLLKPPRTGEPVSSGITDQYGYVSLSTGTGLYIVRAIMCKGPTGKDLEYSEPFKIDSLPAAPLDLEINNFREPERPICLMPTPLSNKVELNNLRVTGNRIYIVGRLEEDSTAYTDRSYRYSEIPSFLQGQNYIITANDDKCPGDPSSFSLSFEIDRPATVYIAHDDRYARKPAWMADFEPTKESIKLTLPSERFGYSLYRKKFSAGTVILKSNLDGTCQQEGDFGMYSVLVTPQ